MHRQRILTTAVPLLLVAAALAGCADNGGAGGATIQQVGSSTVLPIAAAWAEELAAKGIQVAPAGGGSGRGASAICAGEVDIGDMSRELKASEIETCKGNGIDPLVWKVAFDGITVVVNKDNAFVDKLTIEELEHIWRPNDPAMTWADVREGWPADKIVLYGPDSDSGTFEYFNEEILGKDVSPRSDYTPSADDNVLVEGVKQTPNGLGYFGFAYYLENKDAIKAVPIVPEGGGDAVMPSFDSIADGSYKPLGRPVFMVTNGKPATGTPLWEYFSYAMNEGQQVVPSVGYVGLDQKTLDEQRAWL